MTILKKHAPAVVGLASAAALLAAVTGCATPDGPAPGAAGAAAKGAKAQAGSVPQERIAALFGAWNAALATGDPEKVADRYAKGAVLLPTLSAKVRTDRAGIVDYFGHFLAKKPTGAIKQSVVTVLDEDTAVDAGVYTFALTATDGTKKLVDARYTFVYELVDNDWLIINHHSSAMPTG